jgi:hypothetical protein
MPHLKVRRLTAAFALVLALASAAPALAAPGSRPYVHQAPVVTGLPWVDRLLDWLGFPAARDLPDLHGTYQKSTTATPLDPAAILDGKQPPTINRGGMMDPNG